MDDGRGDVDVFALEPPTGVAMHHCQAGFDSTMHVSGEGFAAVSPELVPPELSVVVPCFNEESVLRELHRRLTVVCVHLNHSYELVYVNDGSVDQTWPILLGLGEADRHVVLVNLARNHGQQLALTAGLATCRGRRVLIIDADLQDPPELLPEMIRIMNSDVDVVYGVRRRREGEGRLKLWTAASFYRLIEKLTDVPIPRDTGDFRLINRRVLDVLLAMPERRRYLRGMISWIGFRQEPLLYDRDVRYAGDTKYSLGKMIRLAVDAITAFSIRPLAFASWLGGASGLLAFALLLHLIVSWLGTGVVAGWVIPVIASAFLSCVQLISLGIMGEYVGRIYDQDRGRPLYLIERVMRWAPGDGTEPPLKVISPQSSQDLSDVGRTSQ